MTQALPETGVRVGAIHGWSVPLGWLAALIAYAAVIYGGVATGIQPMWVTDVAWTVSASIAAYGCFRAAYFADKHLRAAWILFGLAFGTWLVGQLIWDWHELVRQRSVPFPSTSDIFFTAFGVISVAALFAFREPQTSQRMTARNIGNLCLIICSLAVAIVSALLEPMAATNHSLGYLSIALAESMSIIVAFVLSAYFLWSHRWGAHTMVLTLIVLSYAVHGATSLLYIHSLIVSEFGASHHLNIAWIAAMGLQHWASSEQIHLSRASIVIPTEAIFARERRVEALLPGLLLLALVAAAAAFHENLTPRVLLIDGILLGLFALIMLARESWMYARERRLKSLLDQSSAEVDKAKSMLAATLAELRATEEKLAFAARAGNVGLFEHDLLNDRVYYSTNWKRQLGYRDEEIGDSLDEWRHRVHPDDYERALAAIEEVKNDPETKLLIESRLRHKNGSYRWFLSQAEVRRDAAGRAIAIVGSNVDITRLKETEQALRESEARYRELVAQLEERVSERTGQLRDAYSELEGFAYAVSHDLKAPLRAIDGFSHLLLESVRDKLTSAEQDYIARLRQSALRMAALIDGLLAYSRAERRELQRVPVNVRALLHETLAEQELLFRSRHLLVNCEVPDLVIHVDREALLIVMRNLLDNATKFTRKQPQPRIDIRVTANEQVALIAVSDNGIGFDPVYHDQIFSIFNRLHADSEYEGTGVGLALARKAVQRMNGQIWAQSAVGEGATFFIELPLGFPEQSD
jgi:PAS domain S-box-containing protein